MSTSSIKRHYRIKKNHDYFKRKKCLPNREKKTDVIRYANGAITYIHLSHFMGHKEFKWNPDPKINFITGDNGAGKSAILQAINIGLGIGHQQTPKNLEEFTKFIYQGASKAEITIHLYNAESEKLKKRKPYQEDIFGEAIIVNRILERDGKNELTIRGTKCFEFTGRKAVKEHARIMDHFGIDISNPNLILQEENAYNFFTNFQAKHLYQVVMKNIERNLLKKHRDIQRGRSLFRKVGSKANTRHSNQIFRQKHYVTSKDVKQEVNCLIFGFWRKWMKLSGLKGKFRINHVDHELKITNIRKKDDEHEQEYFSMDLLSRNDRAKVLGNLLRSIWQFQYSPIRGLDDDWTTMFDLNSHKDIERFLVEEAKSLYKQFFFVIPENSFYNSPERTEDGVTILDLKKTSNEDLIEDINRLGCNSAERIEDEVTIMDIRTTKENLIVEEIDDENIYEDHVNNDHLNNDNINDDNLNNDDVNDDNLNDDNLTDGINLNDENVNDDNLNNDNINIGDEEYQGLLDANKMLQSTVNELKSKFAKLENEKLKENFVNHDSTESLINELRSKIENLTKENEQLNTINETLAEKLNCTKENENKIATLVNENQDLKTKNDNLAMENVELKKRLKNISSKNELLTVTNGTLAEKINELKSKTLKAEALDVRDTFFEHENSPSIKEEEPNQVRDEIKIDLALGITEHDQNEITEIKKEVTDLHHHENSQSKNINIIKNEEIDLGVDILE